VTFSFDPIVRRVYQVLLGSEVSLRGLHRSVAQKQLDLLKLAAGGAAHLRAGWCRSWGAISGPALWVIQNKA
jgi:hypothetical protein